ncbi:putative membrane protein [Streptomyces zagrosensis]|uniref:Putative membrane protein n=1 Tax=Streptomyces zagrosensis TaxID=1042984 RepID=A0A7W9QAQ7_9ACTN|nr:putative membrane protein [Streptomyces zagrosensis]
MAGERIRLDQPREPRRTLLPRWDAEAFGRVSERTARFLGTGRFIVWMSVVIVLWVVWNTTVPSDLRFDNYPFIFLTLALSLQASYAAPLILLAQNRQDDRDRVNLEQDRKQNERSIADTEYLTREIAALRLGLGEVATRDWIRSEFEDLVRELDRRHTADSDQPPSRHSREREHARADDHGPGATGAADGTDARSTGDARGHGGARGQSGARSQGGARGQGGAPGARGASGARGTGGARGGPRGRGEDREPGGPQEPGE